MGAVASKRPPAQPAHFVRFAGETARGGVERFAGAPGGGGIPVWVGGAAICCSIPGWAPEKLPSWRPHTIRLKAFVNLDSRQGRGIC